MKFKSLVVSAAAGLGVLFCSAHIVPAQSENIINEEFDLNITEERIAETDFSRSTEAELATDNVRLRIGVSVDAERIDVTLRGVTGRVRFRASLEEIRRRIARFRTELNSR